MRVRWVLYAQLWACQALAIEPGQSFAVHLDWPLAAQHLQSLEPLDLHFRVDQCDRFSAQVENRRVFPGGDSFSDWQRTPAPVTPDGHGRYRARANLLALTNNAPHGCYADYADPDRYEVRLVVTCDGDGREAVSGSIPLQYAAAAEAQPYYGPTPLKAELLDGNRLLVASANALSLARLDRPRDNLNLPISQRVALGDGIPVLAHTRARAYVGSSCVYPYCQPMTPEDPTTHAQLAMESAVVYTVDLKRSHKDGDALIDGMVQVPGAIVHLFADSDGSVLVVSRPPDSAPEHAFPGMVVSRITGDVVRTEAVIANVVPVYHPISQSGLFLAYGRDGRALMHRIQSPHVGLHLDAPGAQPYPSASYSPDGRHWIVGDEYHQALCSAATGVCNTPQNAPSDALFLPYLGDAAWLSDGLVRSYHNGGGRARGSGAEPRRHPARLQQGPHGPSVQQRPACAPADPLRRPGGHPRPQPPARVRPHGTAAGRCPAAAALRGSPGAVRAAGRPAGLAVGGVLDAGAVHREPRGAALT